MTIPQMLAATAIGLSAVVYAAFYFAASATTVGVI